MIVQTNKNCGVYIIMGRSQSEAVLIITSKVKQDQPLRAHYSGIASVSALILNWHKSELGYLSQRRDPSQITTVSTYYIKKNGQPTLSLCPKPSP